MDLSSKNTSSTNHHSTGSSTNNNNNTLHQDLMNSAEPLKISRVRSRSSRLLPMDLQQAFSFGDGGLGRRQAPSNILNSPDTYDYDNNNKEAMTSHQKQNLSNRYFWSPEEVHKVQSPQNEIPQFLVKVGKSPINNNRLDGGSGGALPVSPSGFSLENKSNNSQPATNTFLGNSTTPNVFYERIVKDTADFLESPTTTDPDLYVRHPLQGDATADGDEDVPVNSASGGASVRMIGAVQIADYEGSPRRFGSSTAVQGQAHLHLGPAKVDVGKSPSPGHVASGGFRPGFPQRVILPTTPEQREKCDKEKDEGLEGEEQQGHKDSMVAAPYDYMYEFSETRKVLNEFFEKPAPAPPVQIEGQVPRSHPQHEDWLVSPKKTQRKNLPSTRFQESSQDLMFLDGLSSQGDHEELVEDQEGLLEMMMDTHFMRSSKNFTLSPETTDYDSNCGDLDSFSNDLSAGLQTDYGRLYTAMPVLEDGLSSGHASDAESHHNQHQGTGGGGGAAGGGGNEEVIETAENRPGEQDGQATEPKEDVNDALKEIQSAIQRVKVLAASAKEKEQDQDEGRVSPVWVPRLRLSQESLNSDFLGKDDGGLKGGADGGHGGDDELDTDLETDRLLGQQRLEDHFYEEDNNWVMRNKMNLKGTAASVSSAIRHDTGSTLLPGSPTESRRGESGGGGDSDNGNSPRRGEGKSPQGSPGGKSPGKTRNKEGFLEPAVLIEGVLFRAKYLGSTQLVCEGQPTKSTRMMQAEEAVSRIKAPEGESQPSTEVDLFISTEKIMVLNTDLKEIMMDHTLRTISYIADIGDLVVLMARRRFVPQDVDDAPKQNRTPKMICHVFESDEAQFIAQSIGQAFQVAYVEFLKANGIEDHSFVKEMDYQEVLNSQEIFGDELEVFAKKELQKEVVVPKAKGEILGVVIVESGWGSMLPTVVIANLLASGAAARCGHLNIGDQIIAINGLSLVGLPLSTCQTYIRNVKNQTAVKFTVVPCPPVVEVKIKRPNTKYQLGFSVQNGVICSLLRGGIAERGGVRVGHRIIEINNQSVVAVPHDKIVTLLATSVGEILMKTMPTSMFRLLTGQENPLYI